MHGRKYKPVQSPEQLHHYLVRGWGQVSRKTNKFQELSPSLKKYQNNRFVHMPTNIQAASEMKAYGIMAFTQ